MREIHDERKPDRHRDYLMLLARLSLPRTLRRKLDASDVVQDALLKAHTKKDQFEGDTDGQYKAWLRQILRNTLLDELKKLRLPEQSVKAAEDASRRVEKELADDNPSVGSQAAKEELLDLLAKALAELPEDWQEVLVLHYFEGLKIAQIADELNRTRASVAGIIRRGLDRLRENPQLRERIRKD